MTTTFLHCAVVFLLLQKVFVSHQFCKLPFIIVNFFIHIKLESLKNVTHLKIYIYLPGDQPTLPSDCDGGLPQWGQRGQQDDCCVSWRPPRLSQTPARTYGSHRPTHCKPAGTTLPKPFHLQLLQQLIRKMRIDFFQWLSPAGFFQTWLYLLNMRTRSVFYLEQSLSGKLYTCSSVWSSLLKNQDSFCQLNYICNT